MSDTQKRRGAPVGLWLLGVLTVVGGLIARSRLIEEAKDKAYVSAMFDDMIGKEHTSGIDYSDADTALWVVAIGVLLLAVALTVTLVRRS